MSNEYNDNYRDRRAEEQELGDENQTEASTQDRTEAKVLEAVEDTDEEKALQAKNEPTKEKTVDILRSLSQAYWTEAYQARGGAEGKDTTIPSNEYAADSIILEHCFSNRDMTSQITEFIAFESKRTEPDEYAQACYRNISLVHKLGDATNGSNIFHTEHQNESQAAGPNDFAANEGEARKLQGLIEGLGYTNEQTSAAGLQQLFEDAKLRWKNDANGPFSMGWLEQKKWLAENIVEECHNFETLNPEQQFALGWMAHGVIGAIDSLQRELTGHGTPSRNPDVDPRQTLLEHVVANEQFLVNHIQGNWNYQVPATPWQMAVGGYAQQELNRATAASE